MAVHYEWDVEQCNAIETEILEEGEIIEHWFQESYRELSEFMAAVVFDPAIDWQTVLVRNDDNGRSWAYMEDGKLPEFFEDAYQHRVAKVPKRFHAEILKA